jgi:FkbM family methyltransferase
MRNLRATLRPVKRAIRAWRHSPRGFDLCVDLSRMIQPRIIFDVGANVGQSAAKYLSWFPAARICCFEPAEESAAEIRRRLNGRVEVYQLAMGSTAGVAKLAQEGPSNRFRITDDGEERVQVETVDRFCRDHGIDSIDFLKIDTEGFDLEVLKGADALLRGGRIQAVQVEAGMNPDNRLHVPIEAFKAFLEERGYRLYGLYEQKREWTQNLPYLRRTNPLFISPSLIAAGERSVREPQRQASR